ncbi:hypothetical protein [Geodermatophilus ruber]|uniref:Flagellar biosynthetic protein FliP n=1 Tax=Geodermatophilus ruber TaxID=504800 RepID=A0A1I4AP25_9ACTN|nr:hypothetical protein [Geodermatophilus ruber]SFK57671.1 hypothetical protein SAMN04488085_102310 [Geodermatophilus ruber]
MSLTRPAPGRTPATPEPAESRTARRRRARTLVLHYLEMVVAMAVGMVALHPVWSFVLDALGWGAVLDAPEPMAMIMATNMTIGMTLVMRWRRHGWRACAEMAAAMYLPFAVLFVPMWAGLLSSGDMLLWGHVLMLVAMAGAMAIRPHEYAHC